MPWQEACQLCSGCLVTGRYVDQNEWRRGREKELRPDHRMSHCLVKELGFPGILTSSLELHCVLERHIKTSSNRTWCCEVNGLHCSPYLSRFLNLPKSIYTHTVSPLCGPLIGPAIVGSSSGAF